MQTIWYHENKIQNLTKREENTRATVSQKVKHEITLALEIVESTKKKKKTISPRFTTRGIFRSCNMLETRGFRRRSTLETRLRN